jgi:hypothetical protein
MRRPAVDFSIEWKGPDYPRDGFYDLMAVGRKAGTAVPPATDCPSHGEEQRPAAGRR